LLTDSLHRGPLGREPGTRELLFSAAAARRGVPHAREEYRSASRLPYRAGPTVIVAAFAVFTKPRVAVLFPHRDEGGRGRLHAGHRRDHRVIPVSQGGRNLDGYLV